jgi:LPS export ABC transporter protein LptC
MRTRLPLAVLLLGLLALACGPDPSAKGSVAPKDRKKDDEKPSLLFQGFSARASHNGDLVWVAEAERARINHQGRGAHAEVVTVVYYSRGKVVSRARADRAEIDLKDYNIEADGSVEVHANNGVLLRTPHLDWDNKQQRISSEAKVMVVRGHTVLTGKGFTGDRDLRDVRILHDVQAEALSVNTLREDSKSWQKP